MFLEMLKGLTKWPCDSETIFPQKNRKIKSATTHSRDFIYMRKCIDIVLGIIIISVEVWKYVVFRVIRFGISCMQSWCILDILATLGIIIVMWKHRMEHGMKWMMQGYEKRFLFMLLYVCLCCHSVYLYLRNYMNFFAIKDFSSKSLIGIFYDQQFKHSSKLWFWFWKLSSYGNWH